MLTLPSEHQLYRALLHAVLWRRDQAPVAHSGTAIRKVEVYT